MTVVPSHSKKMAPKQIQMLLSFGPKANLPDRRQEGAVVVTRVDAAAPPPVCSVSFCVYCERPLRSAVAVKCPNPMCDVWAHPGCMSVGSNGRCAFCP